MARFLHTSDWQLGLTRHFLGLDAQPRFTAARIDAVRTIGRIARAEECDFVLVCGDVFESNQVDRQILVRSLEAMGTIGLPVFLLPGNHDPLDAGSVYRSPTFTQHRPGNVTVLESAEPISIAGIDLVAAPWFTKRPLGDLVGSTCSGIPPAANGVRVVAGHGAVDCLSPNPDDPAIIHVADVESALAHGHIHYVALGDRHSSTCVGSSGRIWYSGTPEATDYVEEDPGHVLLVDLTPGGFTVTPHDVGTWSFVKHGVELNGTEDVEELGKHLQSLPDKERTVLRLSFVGTLSLRAASLLDELLEHTSDLFATLETWDRRTELAILPDDGDFGDIGLSGFAADALTELQSRASGDGDDALVARDALRLLYRLAGGAR